jgi:hypothetical protein
MLDFLVVKSAVQYPTAIQSLPGMIPKNNRLRRVFTPPLWGKHFLQQKLKVAAKNTACYLP